eukprot:17248_1
MASRRVSIWVFASLCLFPSIFAEFALKPLPFKENALEPFISSVTVSTHYNKHHTGYVNKLNKEAETNDALTADTTLFQIIAHPRDYSSKVVNLASQIFNHEFYWECVKPMEGAPAGEDPSRPYGISDELFDGIQSKYNGFEVFEEEFKRRAKTHFGSGWVWLVLGSRGLHVADGHDADSPISHREIPLLTIDIWEHAYYLDYKNERARYVDTFFDKINWQFVSKEYQEATTSKQEL